MFRIAMVMVLTGLAFVAGGCGGNDRAVATVNNLSTVPIDAFFQPLERELQAQRALRVPPGESRFAEFLGGEANDGLAVELRPADPATGATPLMYALTPPGPYFVRVTGNENAISATRQRSRRELPPEIPEDPRERGFVDDIPPVDPPPSGG